jgi:hypothetical protein
MRNNYNFYMLLSGEAGQSRTSLTMNRTLQHSLQEDGSLIYSFSWDGFYLSCSNDALRLVRLYNRPLLVCKEHRRITLVCYFTDPLLFGLSFKLLMGHFIYIYIYIKIYIFYIYIYKIDGLLQISMYQTFWKR